MTWATSTKPESSVAARPAVRLMIRYGYAPLLLLGVNGAALAIVFADLSAITRASGIFTLVAAALAISFAAERLLPYAREWNRDRGDLRRDTIHFAVNEGMSLVPLLIVPIVAAGAGGALTPARTMWPSDLPLALQITLALLVFDLGQYLFHWASHRWQPLWRLHAVHHSVDRMYGLNGIMKHPVYQLLASVFSLAPLVALGMPESFSLAIAFATFVQLLLQHSNVDYRTGWLRHVLATGEVHRFHHLRGKAGDINFALLFAFWDELFGNAYYTERTLESSDIGLDYAHYPTDYLDQLAAPLRRFDSPAP
jgi:sterol desaturase/sphingolipid hydroxylase (fatty acid hydroxylase superfamily)